MSQLLILVLLDFAGYIGSRSLAACWIERGQE